MAWIGGRKFESQDNHEKRDLQKQLQWTDQTPFPETKKFDKWDDFNLNTDLSQMVGLRFLSIFETLFPTETPNKLSEPFYKYRGICLALRSSPKGDHKWSVLDCNHTTLPLVCEMSTENIKPVRTKLETDLGDMTFLKFNITCACFSS